MSTLNRDDVLAGMQGRFADFYNQYALLKPNGSELRGPCPIHGGLAPNFAVNPVSGHWYCHSGCQGGGDVFDFLERLENLSFAEALTHVAGFAGLSNVSHSEVTPSSPKMSRSSPTPKIAPTRYLDTRIAEELHQSLMHNDRVRQWLLEHRGFTAETLIRFQIGLLPPDTPGGVARVTFPVYDLAGRLTNIRKHLFAYKPDLTDERRRLLGKTLPWEKGLRADLYPLSVLDGAQQALIVEGEADALLANQMGFTAITGTLGAGNWKTEWTELLTGLLRVTILYDADQSGQEGMQKVAASVYRVVPDVRIASYSAWTGKGGPV